MTGYKQFVSNPSLKKGQVSILFEIKVSRTVDNLIDFVNDFLSTKGFEKTGHVANDGTFNAVYNNLYAFGGAVQDGNKIAIRLNEM